MTASSAVAFTTWSAFLGLAEGVLSLDKQDSGNWSSGQVGVGRLIGTKFGIAASSHPGIDIPNLTLEAAVAIRKAEYWDAICGDNIHPSAAFVLAEAAFMSGPQTATKQLQTVLGFTGQDVDGDLGPMTKAKLKSAMSDVDAFLVSFSSARLLFEASLGAKWDHNKGGWTSRLFRGLLAARSLA